MKKTAMNPDECLQQLIAGNRRYSLGVGIHPNQTLYYRDQLLSEQYPLAVIVGCSDSRVPPEIIFDCGLGDLFVIRQIGHVVDESTLASVQFAVEQLRVNLILALGHTGCRAVGSAVATQGTSIPGVMGTLLARIAPAVSKALACSAGDPVQTAIIENIRLSVTRLRDTEWAQGIMIRGGLYDLKSGLVTLDPEL